MKVYILLDKNNIVCCLASEESNLHKDKLHMDKYYVEFDGIVGDEYDPETNFWISRPENYPQPTEKQKQEKLINKRKNKIVKDQAIAELITEGLLPPDYKLGDENA